MIIHLTKKCFLTTGHSPGIASLNRLLTGFVRIMFEVEDLRTATPATVSRCGMVWFSEEMVALPMMLSNYMGRLRHVPIQRHVEFMTHLPQPGVRLLAEYFATYDQEKRRTPLPTAQSPVCPLPMG